MPAALAGHSLGEYTALVAAGALALSDALPLVRERARMMQQAVPVGAGSMAAILGLDADAVREQCARASSETGEVVAPANFNDPKQTVIAGTTAAVARACELAKAAGARRALPLAVSAPFHCSLMKPAALRLKAQLATTPIASPSLPVISNIDVRAETDPDAIRDALYRQAFGAVRWVEIVRELRSRGVTQLVECGPGKVLAGLARRIDETLVVGNVFDPASLAQAKGLSS